MGMIIIIMYDTLWTWSSESYRTQDDIKELVPELGNAEDEHDVPNPLPIQEEEPPLSEFIEKENYSPDIEQLEPDEMKMQSAKVSDISHIVPEEMPSPVAPKRTSLPRRTFR